MRLNYYQRKAFADFKKDRLTDEDNDPPVKTVNRDLTDEEVIWLRKNGHGQVVTELACKLICSKQQILDAGLGRSYQHLNAQYPVLYTNNLALRFHKKKGQVQIPDEDVIYARKNPENLKLMSLAKRLKCDSKLLTKAIKGWTHQNLNKEHPPRF